MLFILFLTTSLVASSADCSAAIGATPPDCGRDDDTALLQVHAETHKLKKSSLGSHEQKTTDATKHNVDLVKSKMVVPNLASIARSRKWFRLEVQPPEWAKNIGTPGKGIDKWSLSDTVALGSAFAMFICFDIFIIPKLSYTVRSHCIVFMVMLVLSAAYGFLVFAQRGVTDMVAWATGWVVEIALSTDNLFVFHVIFKAFRVPDEQAGFALTVGIYGAMFFRVIFIVVLSKLIKVSHVFLLIVGLALIASGIMALSDDDDDDVDSLYTVRFFKWVFGSRLYGEYAAGCRLFVKDGAGSTQITMLFLVTCVVAVVDVFFAVDSVGSKIGQIPSIYINLSSSFLAMFTLRALFFLVRDAVDYFELLKYGIASILVLVGVQVIISKWVDPLPLGINCVVIAGLFAVAALASVIKAKLYPSEEDDDSDLKGSPSSNNSMPWEAKSPEPSPAPSARPPSSRSRERPAAPAHAPQMVMRNQAPQDPLETSLSKWYDSPENAPKAENGDPLVHSLGQWYADGMPMPDSMTPGTHVVAMEEEIHTQ
jgi:tellurite resistance protein TerC